MKTDHKASIKHDGYEFHCGFRIRQRSTNAGKRYQVDLGRRSGRHIRKSFKTLQEARNWAYTKSIEADNRGISALRFTDDQKSDAVEALGQLKDFGVNLRTAAAFYTKHHMKVDHNNGTAFLIEEYLTEQAQRVEAGTLRPRTYDDATKRLKPLKEMFGRLAIDTLTADDIKRLLIGYRPQNAANYKRYTSMFFRWAMKKGRVQGNPVELLDSIKLNDDAPEIYEPKQARAIIGACTKNENPRTEMLPYFSLAFFAGIRPDEIRRLDWADINLEEGIIHIRASVSKTKAARFIEMPTNLRHLLSKYPDRSGPVFPWSESSLKRWRKEVYKKAEVPSIQDGARHSTATYYLALHTIEETTELLGHADKVLFRHYKGLIKGRKTKATDFFSIGIESGKVIKFQRTGTE